jgi:hypothetical protein
MIFLTHNLGLHKNESYTFFKLSKDRFIYYGLVSIATLLMQKSEQNKTQTLREYQSNW